MSTDFYYYKSYGHEKLHIDFTLLTPDEVTFAQRYLTLFDSQTLLDFSQSFRFSLTQLADKNFQRALYFLNKGIRTPKVHLGFPQLFFRNDNSDIAAINFLLIKPSTHIHVFTNPPPKRDVDKIIAEVKYYMNYSKYFQMFFWYNEEKELQKQAEHDKKSPKRKSKSKSPKRKSKAKSKAKSKRPRSKTSKRKSKSKSPKRKSKAKSPKRKSKSKAKSKSKRPRSKTSGVRGRNPPKRKSKSKSPKRKSPKRKSKAKSKSKSKSKSPKRKSKSKSPKRKSKSKSKSKSPKRKSKAKSKSPRSKTSGVRD
ncbi:MAG: hypothetical protein EBU90_15100 [Proteobacteria bacterium]|nr:hypothetical protein [Pseudomonadota bacterium]